MRPIHVVQLDKARLALILTRELVRPHLRMITIAPITSTIRGGFTELAVGKSNGLDHSCVVRLDNIQAVDASQVGRLVGFLLPDQERELATAISRAFDLADPGF
ncbi:mRNA interferase MazF3 [Knoellia sinensis KCTC 19936]|uniref:mRNA interferase MazF3 n=1 Tax=Knoellia sinensis KCTC 19936 TaxID=1385520 RepID=A0A0A0JF54_9MICO|nr:type II toxin-antitoxin system PemK/MazF family toxin [Knoellia sinensis]KGN34246.1 mRNA interferase MazF3 [Knoellia sinensis KCTC 19936]